MQELFTFTPFASSGDGFNLSATEKDGQAWFIAADVCRNLEIKNYRDAVAKLDDDEKGVGIADTPTHSKERSPPHAGAFYLHALRLR